MSLQFFIGNSGTGKSYSLYRKVLEEAKEHPQRQYLVLVPEQFTLQTQKDFVRMSLSHGILNIDILSFQRLAYRVFEETGAGNLPVLDELGKIFVVRRVAQEQKEQLLLMARFLSKIGYINEVKSMISELVQYDISTEELENLIHKNQDRQQIFGKLHDVKILYDAFREFLKEKFITSEELLDVLARVAQHSAMIRDAVIVLDGFTGFTPVQKKLMKQLLGLCRDMWVTVTYDTSVPVRDCLPDYHLFYMSAKMMKDLKDMAEELGVNQEKDVIFPAKANYRFAGNLPMAALERHLFRNTGSCYEEEQDAIRIHVCRNPLEETEFAAEEIRRLVMSGRYRYGDIAIVTGNLAVYSAYVQRIFPKYEIPYFSDYKRNALNNPAIACIRSLMECASGNFTYEAVGKLWKTGLMPFKQEEMDVMQNYMLARGIRGKKRWLEPWTSLLKGMEDEELEQLNWLRESFITPMLPFVTVFRSKKTTVREKTIELCKLLEQYKVQEQLEQYTQYFEQKQEPALAEEYSRMYRIVIGILERLVELLGDETMDGKEYAGLLEAGFSETKVGIVPPGVDEVVVGDIERSRLKDIRVLFFLGVNDGVIPKHKTDAGILSEIERETLKEQGMTLSPGREEQYYTQRFYLYLNLTKPQDKLYLTYSKVDASGEMKNPSYLIGVMQKMFSRLEIQDEEERRKKPEAIVAPVNGMHYITGHYRQDRTQEFYALYRWFEKQPDYAARIRALRTAATDERSGGQIHQALARALYGGELSGSVTRLERYAACAYAHFLQYGLRAGEREEFGFDHLDFGNLMHDALDKYAKELKHRNLLWTQVSEEEQKQLIELCVDRAVMERDASVLYYSARDKYRITRMKRMGVRTVWALTKQLEEGKFIPSGYELKFQSTKELKNGLDETALLNLRGKIDRMDICETDEKVMVKVMDYKTGQKEFRLLELYSGTQLQLVVYLQAAMKFEQKRYREKEVIPAGILYYMVEDPVVEVSGEEDTKTPILKELLVDGVVREDREILAAFDRKFEEPVYSYKSGVIPVGTKKDGNFLASSKTVSEEEFQVMMDYAEMKIEQMGEDILKGDVRVNPYQSGKVTACGYCPYSDVCVQERNGARLEYRDLSNPGDSILYANMKQELKRHSEETQKEARSELQTERQNEVSGHTDRKEEREWQ